MYCVQMRGLPPPNMSAILREEREKRQALEKHEKELYDHVLKERQHIELVLLLRIEIIVFFKT